MHTNPVGPNPTPDKAPDQTKTEPGEPAPDLSDYPVREYVRAMAVELAQMALWDGDSALCKALEAAAEMAGQPVSTGALRRPKLAKRAG